MPRFVRPLLVGAGALLVLVLVFVLLVYGYIFYRAWPLAEEGKRYADETLVAIASPWNAPALLSRMSPQAKDVTGLDQLTRTAAVLQDKLGALRDNHGCTGPGTFMLNIGQPNRSGSEQTCAATFEKGDGTVTLSLVKIAGVWLINGFKVNSPLLKSPDAAPSAPTTGAT